MIHNDGGGWNNSPSPNPFKFQGQTKPGFNEPEFRPRGGISRAWRDKLISRAQRTADDIHPSMKSRLRFLTAAVTPLGVASVSGYWFVRYPRLPEKGPPDADNALFRNARREYLGQPPATVLVRSLFVHSFCTHPWLVDYSTKFMNLRHGKSIPVLDSLIRHTFFAHFCG